MPLFQLTGFAVYELDTKGLKTILLGDSSERYSDRYSVQGIDYTDNSELYIANMRSDYGLYRGSVVELDGNVTYIREDGLTFMSQKALYDKKSTLLYTDEEYTIFKGEDRVRGDSLRYNNTKNTIDSKNIEVIYQLQEGKK